MTPPLAAACVALLTDEFGTGHRSAMVEEAVAGWPSPSMAADDAGISTIHVVGFHDNANDREMENFCRFLPGFMDAKASLTTSPKLWVRFDSKESAENALPFVDKMPFDLLDPEVLLRASIAKTNLNVRERTRIQGVTTRAGPLDYLMGMNMSLEPQLGGAGAGAGVPHGVAAVGAGRIPAGGPSTGARRRDDLDASKWKDAHELQTGSIAGSASKPGMTDTVIFKAIEENGVTEQELQDWFEKLEGFVMMSSAITKYGTNVFAKFEDVNKAEYAIEAAKFNRLEAEMARTSLDPAKINPSGGGRAGGVGGASWAGAAPIGAAVAMAGAEGDLASAAAATAWSAWPAEQRPWKKPREDGADEIRPWKRPRGDDCEDAEGDTLVIMGVETKGLTHVRLEEFFQPLEGFVISNFNPTGKGGGNYFVKFRSPALAGEAFDISEEAGLGPQVARNSLSVRKLEKWL